MFSNTNTNNGHPRPNFYSTINIFYQRDKEYVLEKNTYSLFFFVIAVINLNTFDRQTLKIYYGHSEIIENELCSSLTNVLNVLKVKGRKGCLASSPLKCF